MHFQIRSRKTKLLRNLRSILKILILLGFYENELSNAKSTTLHILLNRNTAKAYVVFAKHYRLNRWWFRKFSKFK